uniref:ABC transporter permease n=1 Tax=Scinaia undulata TaxID=1884664 RepID=A0A1G4NXT7_9FLOR|nr:Hypothetical protein ycf63 [Scinaia undulata]SCW23326.1 Hypothetical protein ycf63 [Scinaia undulata]
MYLMLLQVALSQWSNKLYASCVLMKRFCFPDNVSKDRRYSYHLLRQCYIIGIGSLAIVLLASFFLGMIFTFQVAKELKYLNATQLVGSVLTATFVRELSPVLTAVIITGRIGSAFTAEIAAMKVTDQIDVLVALNIDPFDYLIKPRVWACLLLLPVLNMLALAAAICSSIFVGSMLYQIPPIVFVMSSSSSLYLLDLLCSSIKAMVFGFIIGIVSCSWGMTSSRGSSSVGRSTTSSVVTILLIIFVVDFILSFFMFRAAGILVSR